MGRGKLRENDEKHGLADNVISNGGKEKRKTAGKPLSQHDYQQNDLRENTAKPWDGLTGCQVHKTSPLKTVADITIDGFSKADLKEKTRFGLYWMALRLPVAPVGGPCGAVGVWVGQAFGGGQGVGAPPPSKSVWVWSSISLAGILMLKTEQTPKSVSVAIAIRSLIRHYLRGYVRTGNGQAAEYLDSWVFRVAYTAFHDGVSHGFNSNMDVVLRVS